jgi:phosphate starvation-inducible protein PhoH and related proteins
MSSKKRNKAKRQKTEANRAIKEEMEIYNSIANHNSYSWLEPQQPAKIYELSEPKNKNQQLYVDAIMNPKKQIVIGSGVAGTGKTLLATEYGIKQFNDELFHRIVFTRPTSTCDGEELGFLPGGINEKMDPYFRPVYDILAKYYSDRDIQFMLSAKTIEIVPLAFMRGMTFDNCFIIADEMQNSSVQQMKMLLTRIGSNSKMVLTGDIKQHDRKQTINGLEDLAIKLSSRKIEQIEIIDFKQEDVERNPLITTILDLYD